MRKSKETASYFSHEHEQQGKKFKESAIHHGTNICKQKQAVSRVAAKQQDPQDTTAEASQVSLGWGNSGFGAGGGHSRA